MKKEGSEGEKERWRVEKKGGVKKAGFKGEEKRLPFRIQAGMFDSQAQHGVLEETWFKSLECPSTHCLKPLSLCRKKDPLAGH